MPQLSLSQSQEYVFPAEKVSITPIPIKEVFQLVLPVLKDAMSAKQKKHQEESNQSASNVQNGLGLPNSMEVVFSVMKNVRHVQALPLNAVPANNPIFTSLLKTQVRHV